MSSDAHLRRDFGTPQSTAPYIDWGPNLPGKYDGGRARLLIANPRALFVTWETGLQPNQWRLEVAIGGETKRVLELAGDAADAWIAVTPRTRGEVRLLRDGQHVATLPFETPPDAPSNDVSERWARVDASGAVQEGASIGGNALTVELIVPRDDTTSSSLP